MSPTFEPNSSPKADSMRDAYKTANDYFSHGNYDSARKICEQSLKKNKSSYKFLFLLSLILLKQRHLEKSLFYCKKALQVSLTIEALSLQGYILMQQNNFAGSLESFNTAISIKPTPELWNSKGLLFKYSNNYQEAEKSFETSIGLDSAYTPAYANLGSLHLENGNQKLAIAIYQTGLKFCAEKKYLLNGLGICYDTIGDVDKALSQYYNALEYDPTFDLALINAGRSLIKQNQHKKAIIYLNQAIEINPHDPDSYQAKAVALFSLGIYNSAVDAIDLAILNTKPQAALLATKGQILEAQENYEAAIGCYQTAWNLDSTYPGLLERLAQTKSHLCDWSDIHKYHSEIIENITKRVAITAPFCLLNFCDSPRLVREASELFIKKLNRAQHPSSPLVRLPVNKNDTRITIGYFSADFYNHATSYLIAELFERHNFRLFRVILFSFGKTIDDEMHLRIKSSGAEYINIQTLSDQEIVSLSRSRGVDIAVDLKGHTKDSRPKVFEYRCAPIQVTWLGYPATTGSENLDYLIADHIVIPVGDEDFYTEKIIRLPYTYQVNPSQRAVLPTKNTRESYELPSDCFVFCCFNASYKITEAIFNSWIGILSAIPRSVLWLYIENDAAKINLRNQGRRLGVNPERIIFASRLPNPQHLSRYLFADLFLDTFPYGGHTTASDALWMGLPLVTLHGRSFQSRVASSLLHSLGIEDLITYSMGEYVSCIKRLALNPHLLKELRGRLSQARQVSPVFDTARFCRSLEKAYERLYKNFEADYSPRSIEISDVDS
jgi:predicted O-linked N-acetylglucosamine transferase (SPINDLY family)